MQYSLGAVVLIHALSLVFVQRDSHVAGQDSGAECEDGKRCRAPWQSVEGAAPHTAPCYCLALVHACSCVPVRLWRVRVRVCVADEARVTGRESICGTTRRLLTKMLRAVA